MGNILITLGPLVIRASHRVRNGTKLETQTGNRTATGQPATMVVTRPDHDTAESQKSSDELTVAARFTVFGRFLTVCLRNRPETVKQLSNCV